MVYCCLLTTVYQVRTSTVCFITSIYKYTEGILKPWPNILRDLTWLVKWMGNYVHTQYILLSSTKLTIVTTTMTVWYVQVWPLNNCIWNISSKGWRDQLDAGRVMFCSFSWCNTCSAETNLEARVCTVTSGTCFFLFFFLCKSPFTALGGLWPDILLSMKFCRLQASLTSI